VDVFMVMVSVFALAVGLLVVVMVRGNMYAAAKQNVQKDSGEAEQVFEKPRVPRVEVDITKTSVKHDESTHSTDAVIYFDAQEVGDSGKLVLQCIVDEPPWAQCESPITRSDLKYGEHNVRFRLINSEGNIDGYESRITWTVLPKPVSVPPRVEKPLSESARKRAGSVVSGGVPVILKPTMEGSGDAPFPPKDLDTQTIAALQKAREERRKQEEEDKVDPSLLGPFTEARLIDLTPRQLRKALTQSAGGTSYTKDQVTAMGPEDIRDLFRTWRLTPAGQPNPWCNEKVPSAECGPNDVIRLKVWPKGQVDKTNDSGES